MSLIERLTNIILEADRANLFIPTNVAHFLRIHGFRPHHSYLRPPRPPPPPPRAPCSGVTRAGTPCKNKCSPGNTTCLVHAPRAPRVPRALPVPAARCTETVKGGAPCKCPKYKNLAMCWRHAKSAKLLPPPPEIPAECAICYNDMSKQTTTKTACGHYFHTACFAEWKQSRTTSHQAVTCPMCRHANPNPKPLVKPPKPQPIAGIVHQN